MLLGNVGADPKSDELKRYAFFSLATNESYQDSSGNWIKSTQWHSIKVWDNQRTRLVERVLKLRKGNKVLVEGKIKTYQSGEQRMLEIVASRVSNLSNEQQQPNNNSQVWENPGELMGPETVTWK